MAETFKVIVAGTRTFNNYDLLRNTLDRLLSQKGTAIEIVSGGATGADTLGERYAAERGYQVTKFPANWEQYGKKAGPLRNTEMAKYADALVAFYDGVSRGTADMISKAEKYHLQTRTIRYESWYKKEEKNHETADHST